MRKITLLFILILFSFLNLMAQYQPQKALKNNFQEEAKKAWKMNRAKAESLAVKNNMPIKKEFSNGRIIELQGIENGIPVYNETDNINAAATVSSNKVWKDNFGGYSLSGKGVTLGEWDGGSIRLTHREISGRALQKDTNPIAMSSHSTHVAGTMISTGIDANAKGMSSEAKLNAYDWNNAESEMVAEAQAGLKTSNHSYGQVVGWSSNYRGDGKWAWFGDTSVSKTEDYKFGLYTGGSAQWDLIAFQNPYYLPCKSAGNNRGEGASSGTEHWILSYGTWVLSTVSHEKDGGTDGYDGLEYRALAKNVLTVGAVNPIANSYSKPSDVVMSTFSDWGPTDDGRIKPDICADGVNVYSLTSTADNAYTTMSGTSMATPNTTGSLGLIIEHQNNLHPDTALYAATIKGLVIHTADEAGINPGPDYSFGWGLLNTYKAVQLMSLNAQITGSPLIKEYTINQNSTVEYNVTSNGNEPLKVTICWTDWPGNPPLAGLNPPDIMLVNDLDLRVIGPNGTYMPWVLDPANPSKAATTGDNIRDNVEQVLINAPAAGTYTIRVSYKGSLYLDKQNFSMIVSGITLPKPEVPELNFPLNGSVEQEYDMMFKWNRSAKSTSYQIQVATDSLFTNIVAKDSLIGGVQKTIVNLPTLKFLFWRVRGVNNSFSGDWSTVWKFKSKIGQPSVPALAFPSNGATGVALKNVTLKWLAATNAVNYNLKVNAGIIPFVTAANLTDTSYTVTSQMTDGKKYTWAVNAVNTSGTSVYSSSWSFTTLLLAPDSLVAVNAGTKKVNLTWADKSASEVTYYVARKKNSDSKYSLIDSLASNSTSYTDSTVDVNTTYLYKVYCANSIAKSDSSNEASVKTLTSVNQVTSYLPKEYTLMQNYPNPFNPNTVIKYALPFNSEVKLTVYNILGKVVKELVSRSQAAGFHEVNFDGSAISSGVYFYRITAKSSDGSKEFRDVKKLILMK